MNRVFLTLGSNIEKEKNLPASVTLLHQHVHIVALSNVYETKAIGFMNAGNFFNAAALIETPLTAKQLKTTVLTTIEHHLKRQRTTNKNAPRTIDLDICLFNDECFVYDGREIPDPDLLKFSHIAVPVADLAPTMPHPITGDTLNTIAQRLLVQDKQQNGHPTLWLRPDVRLG